MKVKIIVGLVLRLWEILLVVSVIPLPTGTPF